MGRILAIDYGLKRVGLAVTDPLQIIASPLTTIPNSESSTFISEYLANEDVEKIVVGMPRNLLNKPTDATQPVINFISKLKKLFPDIPILEVDERYTSKLARDAIINAGAKKKQRRDKNIVDKVSASLILQTYLQI